MKSQITIKEKLVQIALSRATKERSKLMELITRNPYSELIELETNTLAECKMLTAEGKYQQSLDLLDKCAKKRSELLSFAKRQQNSLAILDRICELDSEISSLSLEQVLIDQNKRRQTERG